MVRQQWQRVTDGEAAVAEGSTWCGSSGREFKMARQQWSKTRDGKTAVAEDYK